MPFILNWARHELKFKFQAKTSRGALQSHTAYYLTLSSNATPEISGTGEAAPLAGLSIDATPDFEKQVQTVTENFNRHAFKNYIELWQWLNSIVFSKLPSLKFGLETAFLDYEKGGSKVLFDSAFSRGEAGIPINGLIWMGDRAFMQEQILKKLREGFSCLKMKIGGLDFETECRILRSVREIAAPEDLIIRLDANGAFNNNEAARKLEKLAQFQIHSIEQPIKQGQLPEMRKLCETSPIPVALDEELIGITTWEKQKELLEAVAPPYIILKPTLLGGLSETKSWISLAKKTGIKWWITSALESNIGLNAIAQFTATYPELMPQGLGTGQLYHNNIDSPLEVRSGYLHYNAGNAWQSLQV